jgi:hypothetical protein
MQSPPGTRALLAVGAAIALSCLAVLCPATARADGDGRVSLDEAHRYAYRRTLASTARTRVGEQHVTLEADLAGQGEIPVTFPAEATAKLALPAPLEGRVLVQQRPSRAVMADVQKAPGAAVQLALVAGRYDAVVSQRTGIVECPVDHWLHTRAAPRPAAAAARGPVRAELRLPERDGLHGRQPVRAVRRGDALPGRGVVHLASVPGAAVRRRPGPGKERRPCALPDDCASDACEGASVTSVAAVFGALDAGCRTAAPGCDPGAALDSSASVCACFLSHGGACR